MTFGSVTGSGPFHSSPKKVLFFFNESQVATRELFWSQNKLSHLKLQRLMTSEQLSLHWTNLLSEESSHLHICTFALVDEAPRNCSPDSCKPGTLAPSSQNLKKLMHSFSSCSVYFSKQKLSRKARSFPRC